MRFLTAKLITLFAALCLVACTSVPTNYYQLSNSSFIQPEPSKSAIYLQVQLAEYLNNANLVYLPAPNQVHFAKNHLWAENLAKSIAKSLANQLNQLDKKHAYLIEPVTSLQPKLVVTIEKFYGAVGGKVITQGYAKNYAADGGLQKQQNFSITKHQDKDGYQAMVQSLSDSLKELAHQVCQASGIMD